jgi:hypothetical protein
MPAQVRQMQCGNNFSQAAVGGWSTKKPGVQDLLMGWSGAAGREPFENGTPLWFYILAESERRELGLRLGDVGARIVAEVFLTNLKRDKGSYLKAKPAFQPSVPHQGDFTIGDFLQFAGVVQSSGSE